MPVIGGRKYTKRGGAQSGAGVVAPVRVRRPRKATNVVSHHGHVHVVAPAVPVRRTRAHSHVAVGAIPPQLRAWHEFKHNYLLGHPTHTLHEASIAYKAHKQHGSHAVAVRPRGRPRKVVY